MRPGAAGCSAAGRRSATSTATSCSTRGAATASDLEGLGEEVRRRVHAMSGVTLEWEIRRIGVPAGRPEVVA